MNILSATTTYSGLDESGADALGVFVAIFVLFYLAVIAAVVIGLWKVFSKAGKPGWAAIVPIYNVIVLLEVTGRPIWWIVLFLIPFANIVMVIIVMLDLAKSFGKSPGFGVGLALLSPVFVPILGFGSATYRGPSAPPSGGVV